MSTQVASIVLATNPHGFQGLRTAADRCLGKRIICAWILSMGLGSAAPAVASHCEGDTLVGGGGNDTIVGSNCDDILVGNDGNNEVTGRLGHDLFVFSTGHCRGLEWQVGWLQVDAPSSGDCSPSPIPFFPSFGVSEITDFTRGFDRITLDRATFIAVQSEVGIGLSDPDDLAVVDSAAATETDPAVIVYSTASETLFYNENGPAAGYGQGGPFAHLPGVASLESSDFQVLDWTSSDPPTTTSTVAPSTTSTSTSSTTTATEREESTTTMPASTTTTSVPCDSARCIVEGALNGSACSDNAIPIGIGKKLDRALELIDNASGSPKKAAKLEEKAGRLLKKAAKASDKASRGKKPKLSADCADEIQRGVDRARDRLSA